MDYALVFTKVFLLSFYFSSPLVLLLLVPIISLGQVVGKIEKWKTLDSLYWSFITATTVGYGDMKLSKKRSKVLSIIITFSGMVLTGVVVAISIRAATVAFEVNLGKEGLIKVEEKFNEVLGVEKKTLDKSVLRN